ncbi:putative tripeptidyl peptidase a protein [Botrytis fragariae]|uniref:tripeptidyl-peptidase II n=1 Tax=Botrytis fragariae TaxID=1964551 RepID=A0A8H6AJA2_9HELO|nr:putative tripeptidyl peptidase a protein [Botrytis fragariae]KAF5868300.1 putative tripeptidyl peptidase a protein [Botrytis fragariae]
MYPKTAICAGLLSQALPAYGAVMEKLAAAPSGWTAASETDSSAAITLTVGLAMQNLDQLEAKLLAVSTPGNAKYGNHLDIDEANALFAPSADASTAVTSWLTSAGAQNIVSDGSTISFATTIEKANSMLNATFQSYTSNGVTKVRTTQYSVPDDVAEHIELISPTTYFGKTVANVPTKIVKRATSPSKVTVDAACSTSITPKCIKELYNIGNYTPSVSSGSRIGFGSFLNQSALYADLFQYESYFDIPEQNFTVTLINGATNDQNEATAQIGEANLDVQNIIGVAHPLPVQEFITGGSPPFIPNIDLPTAADNSNEPYLPYYEYLLSQPNSALPQVISNSYGDDEDTVPYAYAVRVCNLIGIMGLRGISVLESSGDTGVGAGCVANDGLNTPYFQPQFPAVAPEVAWDDGSGGFSNYFSTAWYQVAAVDEYLSKHISPSTKEYYESYTNFSGRGFPDISAHSLTPDYQVVYDGELSPSGGTSAAAPVLAGILGLLNDARFKAGKPALGFVNPLLYLLGTGALNDITGGASVGCNGVNGQTGATVPGGAVIPYASWNATTGWDPVTGLGTPNFEKLKALVLKY